MAILQIKMTKKQNKALKRMARELGTDVPGVLQTGFALLAIAIREQKAGNKLAIAKNNKIVKEIIGVW